MTFRLDAGVHSWLPVEPVERSQPPLTSLVSKYPCPPVFSTNFASPLSTIFVDFSVDDDFD